MSLQSLRFGRLDCPADGDARRVGGHRPLPAALATVAGIGPGPLPATGGLMQAPVDGDLLQVQADDAVVGGNGFVAEAVENPGTEAPRPPGGPRGLPGLVPGAR